MTLISDSPFNELVHDFKKYNKLQCYINYLVLMKIYFNLNFQPLPCKIHQRKRLLGVDTFKIIVMH